ncbi:hypothetical protein ACQ0P8_09640 [Halodesulfovibrio aestuarii]|nr:hypothetical protein [Halodesulfovibrio aestuarii]
MGAMTCEVVDAAENSFPTMVEGRSYILERLVFKAQIGNHSL